MAGDVPPPRPQSEAQLGFRRKRMVAWFDPAQLAKIASQTYRASEVVSLVDEREIEALLQPPKSYEYSGADDFWFDYVADIGDGFDSTYSVAYLLAQPTLG